MKVSGRPYGEANTALIKIKIKLKPENDPTVQEKQAVISVSMN